VEYCNILCNNIEDLLIIMTLKSTMKRISMKKLQPKDLSLSIYAKVKQLTRQIYRSISQEGFHAWIKNPGCMTALRIASLPFRGKNQG
jgi:hypothetical protein